MKRGRALIVSSLVLAVFAVFFFYPAWMVVRQAFQGPDGVTLAYVGAALGNPLYREGLWNALWLGVASTAAALVVAMPLALVSHRYAFPGRSVLVPLALVPMILPPFVGALGIKQILGVNGALNAWLGMVGMLDPAQPHDWLAAGRWSGIVVLNALHLYPILYMNILAALGNLDPALEQAAGNLGCPPWRRFFRVTLPLAMPGVFAGASIVFIWAFTELGVPLVFDFPRVAAVQIFDGIKGLDHNPLPYALAAILLVVATVVFALAKLAAGGLRAGSTPRPKAGMTLRRPAGWRAWSCTALFCGVVGLAMLPHASVVLMSVAERWYGTVLPDSYTVRHYVEALGNGLVVPSIQNSLLYSGCAVALALATGLGAAWVIVRSNLRWRGVLDAVVMMPLAVPGLVMAFGYLALSQEGKPFHFLISAEGSPFMLLVIAYAIRRLPYVVRAAVAGLQQSNPSLEEAAASLGAPPRRVLLRVALPLIGANVAAGAVLAFAFAMLEVSDSLILAQQAQHYPITKAIYVLSGTLGNGGALAAALGVWAMVFLALALIGASMLGGRRGGLFRV